MRTIPSCARLSDDHLRAQLQQAASAERESTADLIALLAVFDDRRLYFSEGFNSLFAYCVEALRLSESAAYSRIQATRAARKWPRILALLADGSLNLTSVGLLAPHLRSDNVAALLDEARHKRKVDVERIVARLQPKPDVASAVRKLPAPAAALMAAAAARQDSAGPPASASPLASTPTSTSTSTDVAAAPPPVFAPPAPAVVAPLAPERYKLQITIDENTREVLRQAQDLMRHANPSGDPAVIVARALRVLVDDLLKKKAAITTRPRPARPIADGSRDIPASVQREVWKRDGGRCVFEGPRGRCPERGFLEFHHVIPYALGGEATAHNIELRCRAHNSYQANLDGLAWRTAAPT